MSMFNP